jgi:deoxyhypusine synthase
MASQVPDIAQDAVLVHSGPLPVEPVEICGYDFNEGVDFSGIFKSFFTTGFQATNFAQAVDEINKMVSLTMQTRYCSVNEILSGICFQYFNDIVNFLLKLLKSIFCCNINLAQCQSNILFS